MVKISLALLTVVSAAVQDKLFSVIDFREINQRLLIESLWNHYWCNWFHCTDYNRLCLAKKSAHLNKSFNVTLKNWASN